MAYSYIRNLDNLINCLHRLKYNMRSLYSLTHKFWRFFTLGLYMEMSRIFSHIFSSINYIVLYSLYRLNLYTTISYHLIGAKQ